MLSLPGHIFSDGLEYSPSENKFLGYPLSFVGWKRKEPDSQLSSLRNETPLKNVFSTLTYQNKNPKGSWLLYLMLCRVFKKRNNMNTPSSVKTKNLLDHIIYIYYICHCFFLLFVFCDFFSTSAQVGLRLPDCTHIYSNKGFSYSIYNLNQGEKEG